LHFIDSVDRQSIRESLPENPSRSVAASPPLNRGLSLILVALVSLGLWAGIWAVVSSLIWR
jgi:hypothetical protein